MHKSTLDLFEKCAIDPNDIEALAAYYEVTCDYYMAEFEGLEEYEDWKILYYLEIVWTQSPQ